MKNLIPYAFLRDKQKWPKFMNVFCEIFLSAVSSRLKQSYFVSVRAPEWSVLQRTRYYAQSMGKQNPQNCSFPSGFHHPAEEDRATATGNMHRQIGKDRACGFGDILVDRQTDRRSHHNTSPPLPWAKYSQGRLCFTLVWQLLYAFKWSSFGVTSWNSS